MSSNELVEQIMAQVIARVATPEQQAIPGQPQPIRETAMAEKKLQFNGICRDRHWRYPGPGYRQRRYRPAGRDEA